MNDLIRNKNNIFDSIHLLHYDEIDKMIIDKKLLFVHVKQIEICAYFAAYKIYKISA